MYIIEFKDPDSNLDAYRWHEEFDTIEEAMEEFHAVIRWGYQVTYFSPIYC